MAKTITVVITAERRKGKRKGKPSDRYRWTTKEGRGSQSSKGLYTNLYNCALGAARKKVDHLKRGGELCILSPGNKARRVYWWDDIEIGPLFDVKPKTTKSK